MLGDADEAADMAALVRSIKYDVPLTAPLSSNLECGKESQLTIVSPELSRYMSRNHGLELSPQSKPANFYFRTDLYYCFRLRVT